jgi:hypothetical protein
MHDITLQNVQINLNYNKKLIDIIFCFNTITIKYIIYTTYI